MKSAENKTGLEHPRGTEQHPMVSAPQCAVVRNARDGTGTGTNRTWDIYGRYGMKRAHHLGVGW